ncbi:MAG: RIP metalloprotease RseP [Alphaproteobacteria bacterium]|nr:RIP metalloprotease RseP [Pseudomonadota bacterium]
MDFLGEIWTYTWSFIVVLTIVVFFHELGHYLIARVNGVRVQTFSIGFGRELFGLTDRRGTRWKFSAVPLGGYVKMFGDTNPASMPKGEVPSFTPEEEAVAFTCKRVGQRAAIVSAGPIANFILAIVLLSILFVTVGMRVTTPQVSDVVAGGPAEAAGIEPGDIVLSIAGRDIERFEDMVDIITRNPGVPLEIVVERDETQVALSVVPESVAQTDESGGTYEIGRIGVQGSSVIFERQDPATAVWLGARHTFIYSFEVLKAVGQMIVGSRSTEELSGPIRIAQFSGEMAKQGLPNLIFFTAVLSISLGLINLFPIPLLDGGHLFFYGIEAARGRPLGPRAQEMIFRFGFAVIVCLVGFVLYNDFRHLGIFDFVENLFS